MTVIDTKKNYFLVRLDDSDNIFSDNIFAFGTHKTLTSPWGIPVNQLGTKEKLIEVLNCWKTCIDFDNPEMIEVETSFIKTLEGI